MVLEKTNRTGAGMNAATFILAAGIAWRVGVPWWIGILAVLVYLVTNR